MTRHAAPPRVRRCLPVYGAARFVAPFPACAPLSYGRAGLRQHPRFARAGLDYVTFVAFSLWNSSTIV
ncbi:hypothetical protein G7Y31_01315 [Corynebacterium lizhenjunii]|uniref:Uncharacterized protein n=1 Tax=Corynebacterium lizhenjunii TaxID=2709394 RepID=A0A7T0KFK3_9CORY|nr:hypothetical protein [Corynebacterium lizhenjunii]QPK79390.1 hypothetical protein G7Y31_01315 [Corynebacterium lizhenjunii]